MSTTSTVEGVGSVSGITEVEGSYVIIVSEPAIVAEATALH